MWLVITMTKDHGGFEVKPCRSNERNADVAMLRVAKDLVRDKQEHVLIVGAIHTASTEIMTPGGEAPLYAKDVCVLYTSGAWRTTLEDVEAAARAEEKKCEN